MSKEGSQSRIAKWKASGNTKNLEIEEAFYAENYGSVEVKKPKK